MGCFNDAVPIGHVGDIALVTGAGERGDQTVERILMMGHKTESSALRGVNPGETGTNTAGCASDENVK